jgi:hypothetical protein
VRAEYRFLKMINSTDIVSVETRHGNATKSHNNDDATKSHNDDATKLSDDNATECFCSVTKCFCSVTSQKRDETHQEARTSSCTYSKLDAPFLQRIYSEEF